MKVTVSFNFFTGMPWCCARPNAFLLMLHRWVVYETPARRYLGTLHHHKGRARIETLASLTCITTNIPVVLQFVMERHSLYRAITIVKSSVAGYVVQPFQIKVQQCCSSVASGCIHVTFLHVFNSRKVVLKLCRTRSLQQPQRTLLSRTNY